MADESNDALVIGVGSEEAVRFLQSSHQDHTQRTQERMIGISPASVVSGEVAWDELKRKLWPWLGKFLKAQDTVSDDNYTEEQYLDLMIQTWTNPDGVVFHSLINCELVH